MFDHKTQVQPIKRNEETFNFSQEEVSRQCHKYSFSILPPNPLELSTTCLSTVDIPPILKERPKLTLVRCTKTTILPRPVYHPAIINACDAMFLKHPSKLMPEEVDKFNVYKNRKIQIGEPLESEVIYLPIGGIRT